jgi:spermidine synthase
MKPRVILDMTVTPDGRELVLDRRDDAFTIFVDSEELMWSRTSGSERALAQLALDELGSRPTPRILVGGLGMGFTLRATLDALGPHGKAKVVVAEVFEAVLEWNRGPLAALAGHPIDDPRVRVRIQDVWDTVANDGPFDVILLDVDNGPESFTLDSNQRLYGARGLGRLHDALTPGGVLTVWSAGDDPRFVRSLRKAGFEARSQRVAARVGGKGGKHVVFVARRR